MPRRLLVAGRVHRSIIRHPHPAIQFTGHRSHTIIGARRRIDHRVHTGQGFDAANQRRQILGVPPLFIAARLPIQGENTLMHIAANIIHEIVGFTLRTGAVMVDSPRLVLRLQSGNETVAGVVNERRAIGGENQSEIMRHRSQVHAILIITDIDSLHRLPLSISMFGRDAARPVPSTCSPR